MQVFKTYEGQIMFHAVCSAVNLMDVKNIAFLVLHMSLYLAERFSAF